MTDATQDLAAERTAMHAKGGALSAFSDDALALERARGPSGHRSCNG
jgi:hypothetical protein